MIENNMELHPAPLGAEVGPRESGQAELDHRGIEAEEFGFEPELVARGHGRASLIHFAEECLEELSRSLGIGIGKGRTGH